MPADGGAGHRRGNSRLDVLLAAGAPVARDRVLRRQRAQVREQVLDDSSADLRRVLDGTAAVGACRQRRHLGVRLRHDRCAARAGVPLARTRPQLAPLRRRRLLVRRHRARRRVRTAGLLPGQLDDAPVLRETERNARGASHLMHATDLLRGHFSVKRRVDDDAELRCDVGLLAHADRSTARCALAQVGICSGPTVALG